MIDQYSLSFKAFKVVQRTSFEAKMSDFGKRKPIIMSVDELENLVSAVRSKKDSCIFIAISF